MMGLINLVNVPVKQFTNFQPLVNTDEPNISNLYNLSFDSVF